MPGPIRRKTDSSGKSGGVKRRGSGLGTGSVGGNSSGARKASGHSVNPFSGHSTGSGNGGNDFHSVNSQHERESARQTRGFGSLLSGKSILVVIVIIAAVTIFGGNSSCGGSFLSGLLGGGGSGLTTDDSGILSAFTGGDSMSLPESTGAGSSLLDILGMFTGSSASGLSYSGSAASLFEQSDLDSLYSTNWTGSDAAQTSVDSTVATGAPAKRTQIYGDSRDMINIMVYMCGTDLESRSGAATADLQEMLAAEIGDNINLLIYTGGCSKWNNNVISSKVNQIYQIKDKQLYSVNENVGNAAMTNPDTLSGFIKFVGANYPANRNMLIFWDHGGGSVSGYGYDEKYASSGSMSLSGIDTALKNGGMVFDLIGFDACLMATVENALMLSEYGDYMIASEEVEPGIGWYYTDWLTRLNANPSMSTLEIGKNIADSFTKKCSGQSYGIGTTLSLVDLAEAGYTIPDKLTAFASSTIDLIEAETSSESSYKTVAKARANAKEFAQSNDIDQVDMVDLALKLNTAESKALAETLQAAVKYNSTSGGMSNAYGLAVYFPYDRTSYVDNAAKIYNNIGVSEKYSECIRKFAKLEVSGQAASGGTGSALSSLLSGFGSSSGSSSSSGILDLLGGFLGGDFGSVSGLGKSNTEFLSTEMDLEAAAEYIAANNFDDSKLTWKENDDGDLRIALTQEDWDLLTDLRLNVFYDDGEGYIDLGFDAYFEYDTDGSLVPLEDVAWLAINDQTVAFYQESSVGNQENYVITGRVPVLYNGTPADLIITFTPEDPYGVVSGVRYSYTEETETIAKTVGAPVDGDTIDFVADYYDYDGNFRDAFMIGEQIVVSGELTVSNLSLDTDELRSMYVLTDIYDRSYWTASMP